MKTIKSKMSLIIVAFLVAVSMFTLLNPVKVYADTKTYKTIQNVVDAYAPDASANVDYKGSWPSVLNGYFDNTVTGDHTTQLKLDADDSTDGNVHYYYYNSKERDVIVAQANTLVDSGNEKTSSDYINDLNNTFPLSADVTGAAGLMSGFTPAFETFLGFLVTLLTIGMTVFTGLDLCYIAFPVFRGKCDDAKANGTKGMTTTDKKTGATKLTIISEDAQFSVVSADMVNTGKSPFVIYFQKRVISFVVLAVLIFILLTGNINIITNIGVKLASGILNVINSSFKN
jgi:hypothetical protein